MAGRTGSRSRGIAVLVAFMTVAVGLALPARAAMPMPVWTTGDYWAYAMTMTTGPGETGVGTQRVDVVGTETLTIGGVPYPCYRTLLDIRLVAGTGPSTMYENVSGPAWYRTADLALAGEDLNGTLEFGMSRFTFNGTLRFDPPQEIRWPLTPGDSWTARTWMNTTTRMGGGPPTYSNVSLTSSFLVEAERPVTVPAGTLAATPLNATANGYANVTYWSPAAGNGALLLTFDPAGAEIQRLELTAYRYQGTQDTAPPVIADVAATPPTQMAGGAVAISANVTDDTAVASVTVNVTRPDGSHANLTMAHGAGNAYAETSTWGQVGLHTFVIWALDAAGNAASANGSFTILPWSGPPSVTLTSPAGGEVWAGGSAHDVVFEVQAGDPTATVWVNLSTDGGATWSPLLPQTAQPTGTPVTAPATMPPATDTTTAEVRVTAQDSGLREGNATSLPFTIDSTPPLITDAKATPPTQTPGGSVRVSANVTDNLALSSVTGVVTTPPPVIDVAVVMVRLAGDLYANTSAWTAVGNYTFKITAVDAAGNSANASGSFAIEAGNAPPLVTLTSPAGGADWTGGSVHDIAYATADPDDPALDVTIEASYDSGATWNPVASLPGEPTGGHAYPWTVPRVNTTAAIVRVCASDGVNPSMCEYTQPFTIDSAAPTVVSVVPAGGATNVALGAAVEINFSEAMNRAATAGNVSIAPATGGIVYSWPTGRLLALSHNDFAPCTRYTVFVSTGARDLSDPGNPLTSQVSWSFDTVCTAPTITLTSPAGGEDWTGDSFHIVAYTTGDPDSPFLAITFEFSSDDGATWSPAGSIPNQAPGPHATTWRVPLADTATARLRVCASDGGNPPACATSGRFTVDSTPPTVTFVSPANGATGVPLTEPVIATFSEPLNLSAVVAPLTLAPAVAGLSYGWFGDVLTVTHDPFAACTRYTATVGAGAGLKDLSDPGNPLAADVSWSFTTACAPTVTLTSPAGGEDWTGGSTHSIAYTTADPDNATVDVVIEVSLDNGTTWSSGPSFPGQATGSHSDPWTVPSVDTAGAMVRACASDRVFPRVCDASGSFTIDSTRPTVVSTDPVDAATGVPVGKRVAITFSEPMNTAATIANVTFAPAVTGLAYTWSGTDRVLSITHSDFEACTEYTVTVGTGATDKSLPGNGLAADYSWSFTTACPPTDTTPPVIVHTPPASAYVGDAIAINATVTDPDSAVQEVRLVYTPVGGTEQNVSMALASGSTYAYAIPAQSAAGTVRYRIYATDPAGNWRLTREYTVTVSERPNPGPDLVLIAVIVAILVAVIVAVALVLWRRKKKAEARRKARSR